MRWVSLRLSLLAVLLAWPVAACTAATASPQAATGNAKAFDAAFQKLNGPAFLDVPSATIEAEFVRLRSLLPANDPARDIHFRSVFCNSLQWKDAHRGRDYSKTAVQLAHSAGDVASEARARLCLATYIMLLDGSQQGLPEIDTAIHLLKEHQEPQLLAEALEMRGDLLSLLGEQAKAMLDFQRARTAFRRAGITQEVNPLMFSMAVAYRRMGDWDRAASYFTAAQQRARAIGDTEAEATNLLQLGFLRLETSAPDKALSAFSQAVSIAQQHADTSSVNAARTGIAEAQILLGKPDAALSTLQQARTGYLADQDNSSNDMLLLLTGRALAAKGQYAQALQRYQQALPLIQANGNERYLAQLHQAQASSEEALGQPAAALQDFKKFHALQMKLRSKMQLEQNQMMAFEDAIRRTDFENRQLRAQAEVRQQELKALERVRHWQWLAIVLALLLLALLCSMAWRQWQRSKKLQDLTLQDPLTGIANRLGIEREVVRALTSAQREHSPMSLLMLDLDRFKSINDRFGHAAGDQVLRDVTRAWQTQLRNRDPLGRVGGEEFIVVCLDADLNKALAVAERLREATQALHFDGIDPGLRVSVSIGAAQVLADGESSDALIQRADRALYRAKHSGGNRIEY